MMPNERVSAAPPDPGSARKRRGRPFEVGNKFGRGRPRGSKNKISCNVRKLLGEHAEAVWRKVILMALQGNVPAQRLCVKYMPALDASPVYIDLPSQQTPRGLVMILDTVLHHVASGQLSAEDGKKIADIVERRRRVLETVEIDERVRAMEELTGSDGGARGQTATGELEGRDNL
jgi:hypothetical protein